MSRVMARRLEWTFWAALFVFVVFKLVFAFKHHPIFWDEAVYLSMGKYLASGFQVGLFEPGRPLVLPVFLALFDILHISSVFWGELLLVASALGSVVLVRRIAERWFNPLVGVVSGLFLLVCPLFWQSSSYILTDVLSVFFVLFTVFWMQRERHLLAGLAAGLAVMTRFPAGLALLVFLGAYLVSWWKSKAWRPTVLFSMGVAIPVVLFFVFHFFHNLPEVSVWWHALWRPVTYALGGFPAEFQHLYPGGFWFYFLGFLTSYPVTVLAVPGLVLLLLPRRRPWLLLSLLLVFFIFFSALGHKELRYGLLFLPFILVLSAWFVVWVAQKARRRFSLRVARRAAGVIWLVLLVFVAVFAFIGAKQWAWRSWDVPVLYREYGWLAEHPIQGKILTTDPVLAPFVPNRVIPGYYTPDVLLRLLQEDYAGVFVRPQSIPCAPEDKECVTKLRLALKTIAAQYRLVHSYEDVTGDYYVFVRAEYLETIPLEPFLDKYGLSEAVELSRFPRDEFPVLVVLEDFPSMNDDFSGIWEEERYEKVLGMVRESGAQVTIAAIPYHYEFLSALVVKNLTSLDVSFAQNGVRHADELFGSPARVEGELRRGRDSLQGLVGRRPSVFIPPDYAGSSTAVDALDSLGFAAYVSTMGDTTDAAPLVRYDQSISLIRSWSENVWLTPEEWVRAKDAARISQDYFMTSVYYFRVDNESEVVVHDVLSPRAGERLMTVDEHLLWAHFLDSVSFDIEENAVRLAGPANPLALELTLLVRRSVNLSISGSYPSVLVKNVAGERIIVCVEECDELASGEIVTFLTGN